MRPVLPCENIERQAKSRATPNPTIRVGYAPPPLPHHFHATVNCDESIFPPEMSEP
jgi:hypothetical protein